VRSGRRRHIRRAPPAWHRQRGHAVRLQDLRSLPLLDRKKRLARLLGGRRLGIVLSNHTDEDGATIFPQACELGLEGIVSRRLSALYRTGGADRAMDLANTRQNGVRFIQLWISCRRPISANTAHRPRTWEGGSVVCDDDRLTDVVEREVADRALEKLPGSRRGRRLVPGVLIVRTAALHHALRNPILLRHWFFPLVEVWPRTCSL
jgi:hypothetical protein